MDVCANVIGHVLFRNAFWIRIVGAVRFEGWQHTPNPLNKVDAFILDGEHPYSANEMDSPKSARMRIAFLSQSPTETRRCCSRFLGWGRDVLHAPLNLRDDGRCRLHA